MRKKLSGLIAFILIIGLTAPALATPPTSGAYDKAVVIPQDLFRYTESYE